VPELFSTSRAEAAIYRYPPLFHPFIVVFALVGQAYAPLLFHFATRFDFPLLVVVYIALTSRSQVSAMLAGSLLGLLQDSLSHLALGLEGIAKTVAGYLGSSLGVRIDADHPGVRLLVVGCLYWLNAVIVYSILRFLMARSPIMNWTDVTVNALINGITAMFLFRIFDRFRQMA
jgi:rod shape-determining protein MreD